MKKCLPRFCQLWSVQKVLSNNSRLFFFNPNVMTYERKPVRRNLDCTISTYLVCWVQVLLKVEMKWTKKKFFVQNAYLILRKKNPSKFSLIKMKTACYKNFGLFKLKTKLKTSDQINKVLFNEKFQVWPKLFYYAEMAECPKIWGGH